MKVCSVCKETKDESHYEKNRRCCRSCRSITKKKYDQSERGQATKKKYARTEKARTAAKKYQRSKKAQSYRKKYNQSERGQAVDRKSRLKRKYNMTVEAYDIMFEQQNGVCAICGKSETMRNQHGLCRLAVDHDHKTDEVRGLLCAKCNLTLGNVDDNKELLLSAALYLEKHSD